MGKDRRAARGTAGTAAQAGKLNSPLGLPGAPSTPLWDELADEAERYAQLLAQLKRTPRSAPERAALERDLMDSLSHLRVHSEVLDEGVLEALELADDLAAAADDA
jgi:hypothetical protein